MGRRNSAGCGALLALSSSLFLAIIAPANAIGQSVATGGGLSQSPEFDAASIKPSASSRPLGTMARDGKLTATGISLKALIAFAYDVREAEIFGGPAWIGSDRFDINAKAASAVSTAELKLMTRMLLEDRFHLRMHREMKEMSVFSLVVEKNGLKLKPSNDVNCTDPNVYTPPPQVPVPGEERKPVSIRCGNFYVLNDRLQGRKVSLQQLASTLTNMNIVEEHVIDKTELNGTFDIDLEWDASRKNNPQVTVTSPDTRNLPSIFDAFQEQFGLNLQPQKSAVEVVFVDNADKPTAN